VTGLASQADGTTLPPQTWSFTTGDPSAPAPLTLFDTETPVTADEGDDASAVELGVKFTTSQPGAVTGVRFYKGSGNTGTHVGHLWTSDGVLLASVTFTNESSSGWQSANFSSPVALTPGTVYVVSYFAPNGNYASSPNYFSTDHASGPLTAIGQGDGMYVYGASGGLPKYSWQATNYFVDVMFQPAT
jgi:hypothetical protein